MRKAVFKFRVYGNEGHRQHVSFSESWSFKFSDNSLEIFVFNSDITGTNDYTDVVIIGRQYSQIKSYIKAQITDGFFVGSNVGKIEEVGYDFANDFQIEIFEHFCIAMLSNDNCIASVDDIFEMSKYIGHHIYDFWSRKIFEYEDYSLALNLIAVDVFKFDDSFRNAEFDVYFDLKLEKPYVLHVWYEEDVEYAFYITSYNQ